MKTETAEKLYDVIIYHMDTREVVSVAGSSMRLDQGHYNAEKRLETVLGRGDLHEDYSAEIVPAGKYKKGDTYQ